MSTVTNCLIKAADSADKGCTSEGQSQLRDCYTSMIDIMSVFDVDPQAMGRILSGQLPNPKNVADIYAKIRPSYNRQAELPENQPSTSTGRNKMQTATTSLPAVPVQKMRPIEPAPVQQNRPAEPIIVQQANPVEPVHIEEVIDLNSYRWV